MVDECVDARSQFGPSGLVISPRRAKSRLAPSLSPGISGEIRMADAKSSVAFARAAVNFDVHESDFLVLCQDKVNTFESMAYRYPQASDLEEYLKKVVRLKQGFREEDGQIVTFARTSPLPWESYKTEEDVGCIRKLWNLSIQVSKRQMERMAGEDGDLKSKVTLTTAQELEDKAVDTGLPVPASDRDRPSLHTLTKVQSVFGPGGNFQHLCWEAYVSMEHEGKLRRAGKIPRDKKELVLDDKKLSLSSASDGAELPETRKVDGILALQDVLELRARSYHLLDVCKYQTVTSYHDKLIGFLRATTADGMRGPTINEIRRADREIMEEILKWVSKGKGSIQAGLAHYAKNAEEPLWKLLLAQPEGMPDQGLEKYHTHRDDGDLPDGRGSKKRKAEEEDEEKVKAYGPRMCIVCKKKHEPRCAIPPGFRKEEKAKRKADLDKKKKKGRDEGGPKK